MKKLIFILILFGCHKESITPVTNPGNIPIELPFDNFVFQTKFGVPTTTPTYYFINSVYFAAYQNGFHYFISDNDLGTVPKGYTRTYVRDNGVITATLKASLARVGNSNPNGLTWKDSLKYDLVIKVDEPNLKMISAIIQFTDYHQKIDLTDLGLIERKTLIDSNGLNYDILSIEISDPLFSRKIHYTIDFTERLN